MSIKKTGVRMGAILLCSVLLFQAVGLRKVYGAIQEGDSDMEHLENIILTDGERIQILSKGKQTVRLTKGEWLTLQWKGAKGADFAWSTDASSSCKLFSHRGRTVEIQAIKPGKTVITAKQKDGTGKKKGVSRKLIVLVENTIQPFPEKEMLEASEAKLKKDGLLWIGEEAVREQKTGNQPLPVDGIRAYQAYFSAVQQWSGAEAAEWISQTVISEKGTGRYFYIVYEGLKEKESLRLYQEDTNKKQAFTIYTYPAATAFSFQEARFQQGEKDGELSVRNKVPGSSYEWSSSHPDVVEVRKQADTDTSVKLWAKEPGEAVITCRVTYPQGESRTLTAKIQVDGQKADEGYTAGEAVNLARKYLEMEGCVPIRVDMTQEERRKYGYDADCAGTTVRIPCFETIEQAAKWLAGKQVYTYYDLQYQGRVGNCFQFGIYGSGQSWEAGFAAEVR